MENKSELIKKPSDIKKSKLETAICQINPKNFNENFQ